MNAGADATGGKTFWPANRRWTGVLATILILWIVLIGGRGIVLAVQAVGVPVAGVVARSFATPQMGWTAAIVVGCCLAAALLARWLRPAATLPVTFGVGAIVLVAAAIATASLGSLFVALAIFAFAWLVGHVALRPLPPTAAVPVVRAPIAVGLGLGLSGLVLFALAWREFLDATTVLAGAAAVLLALLVIDRTRLREDARRFASWRPIAPSWLETVVTGVAVGVTVFALLAVFVPENTSDAILQHLPIAREIWRTGSVAAFPLLPISREPIGGHLLFALAYGFGGMTAAKLMHTGAGLLAIAGVAGIGWLGGGRVAATAGAAIFASMPLVLWLLGHAFLDLFPVLFTVAAVLSLLLWQRDGRSGWLVCAGVLAGSGAATKLPTTAIMIVALGIALLLVGRAPGHWRARIVAAAIFALTAFVVVAPWLARSASISGGLTRFDQLLGQLGGASETGGFSPDGAAEVADSAVDPAAAVILGRGKGDHSPLSLLRLPWDLTFDTERFGFPIIGLGEVGFAGLLLLPLLLFAPRTRMLAFLVVTAAAGMFGWWLTPLQATRHALPSLAIVAVLAGIGFASAITNPGPRSWRALATAAQAGLIVSCVAAVVFFLPARLATLPVELIAGRQSAADYIARQLPLTPVLAAASAELPPDSRGAYIGRHTQVPRIYTDLDMNVYEDAIALGATPEDVLANLDRLGLDFIVWNRYTTNLWGLANWRAPIVATPFLRDHTRIVAGDDNAYVFALVPSGQRWGVDKPRSLLTDPDLDTVGAKGPWTTVGTVRARKGIVSMRAESALAQQAPVTEGEPYLLDATATCDAPDGRATLTLRWLDGAGQELATASEAVYPGDAGSEQFIWRRAPAQAAAVSAEVAAQNCKVDKVELYQLS